MKLLFSSLKAGIIIGILDGFAAVINAYLRSGTDPKQVFRFIASGYFGAKAFILGSKFIYWGVLFHFLIAFGWTLLFFLLYANRSLIRKHYLASGAVYGIFVWGIMSGIVVPLSRTPNLSFSYTGAAIMLGIHILIIGVPVAVLAKKYLGDKKKKKRKPKAVTR